MSDTKNPNAIRSRIWHEEPEPGNAFATQVARCRGYDVYGEMLGQARWVEMLYLLFHEDAPSKVQADMLETLAVALANPGPRDASVHAAMCGGVGGSTAASSLMAALAVGAGQLSGGREVFLAMQNWAACGTELDTWRQCIGNPVETPGSVWPTPKHPPGFDPHGTVTSTPVKQTLACLTDYREGKHLSWLQQHLAELEAAAGLPLALSGVTAAALTDLGFSPEQGEMLHLLLRLPGAAAHALEQRPLGYKNFPFGKVEPEVQP